MKTIDTDLIERLDDSRAVLRRYVEAHIRAGRSVRVTCRCCGATNLWLTRDGVPPAYCRECEDRAFLARPPHEETPGA